MELSTTLRQKRHKVREHISWSVIYPPFHNVRIWHKVGLMWDTIHTSQSQKLPSPLNNCYQISLFSLMRKVSMQAVGSLEPGFSQKGRESRYYSLILYLLAFPQWLDVIFNVGWPYMYIWTKNKKLSNIHDHWHTGIDIHQSSLYSVMWKLLLQNWNLKDQASIKAFLRTAWRHKWGREMINWYYSLTTVQRKE